MPSGQIKTENRLRRAVGSILVICGAVYFLACLHRVAPAVIAPNLTAEFGASATVLGLIASSYFYLYSAVQPLVGLMSDGLGPRKVITMGGLLAFAGALLFARADGPGLALLGRALVGAGAGTVFIPTLKLFSQWTTPRAFATLTGVFLSVGSLGGLTAAWPLAWLVVGLGWRASFAAISLASLGLAAVSWAVVRDHPSQRGLDPPAGEPEPAQEITQGAFKRLGRVGSSLDFWMVFGAIFASGGVGLAFQGLWAAPFLMHVHGLGQVAAGGVLMLYPLGFSVGAPLFGYLTDRLELDRKRVLLTAMAMLVLLFTSLLLPSGWMPPGACAAVYFGLGLFGGGSLPLYMSTVKELFPLSLTGTAMGLMNVSAFLSTALLQPVTGMMLDLAALGSGGQYTHAGYRGVFVVFLLLEAASLAATLAYRDPRRAASRQVR